MVFGAKYGSKERGHGLVGFVSRYGGFSCVSFPGMLLASEVGLVIADLTETSSPRSQTKYSSDDSSDVSCSSSDSELDSCI